MNELPNGGCEIVMAPGEQQICSRQECGSKDEGQSLVERQILHTYCEASAV